jgi:hypothetical protein
MKKAFEPVPLLVAAVIGAAIWTLINNTNNGTTPLTNTILYGALTGLGVQVGLRLSGVS